MKELQYLQLVKKCSDINLQLIETLITLGESGYIEITDELREMLEYTLELNWQNYRLTSEKLNQNGFLL
jgi:hypothetical protein